MKYVVAVVLFFGFQALANGQENSGKKQGISAAIGPGIGEKEPAFVARDQFGHDQTNDTLRGSDGTVLLFFRSADW